MTLPGAWFRLLEDQGIRAMNPAMGFPMEMDRFPGGRFGSCHTSRSRWRQGWE